MNDFDTRDRWCAKRRERPDSANQDPGDVAWRCGKNIDHQNFRCPHLGGHPKRRGGQQASIGVNTPTEANLIEQAEDGGAGN